MAVGIIILSGARQGERLEFDFAEFRAGGVRACQVFFDPQFDPGVSGREALFRLGDDGWCVKNAGGGELLVNDRVVRGSTRLRSGDVVRLSPSGPDFSFNLLARLSAPTASAASAAPLSTAPAKPDAGPGRDGDPPSARGAPRDPTRKQWAIALLVVGVLVAVLLAGGRAWRGGAVAVVPRSKATNNADGDKSPARPRKSGDGVPAKRVVPRTQTTVDDEEEATSPPPTAPQDPWDVARDELRACVFLLAVEEPKTQAQWPFATATAVGGETLLTSATVAVELARFRQRGWKPWAMNQKTGAKIEVIDQRVHVGFERARGQPELQIYADLGVLTVAAKCPQSADLASAAELDELDRGQPLACLGIGHDGQPLSRFQNYAPELARGKVFVITSLPPSPGGPRLLHVRMPLPVKVYGAPVVNEAGRVVGVFAESAPPPADQAGAELKLHYVPIIDLPLVRAWLDRRDDAWWLPPTVPPEPANETKPAAP
ncbi:MAG TPA: FHA domain-containing protein [Pirellulales bacterium]|nr:FHA domain-containing protein [Pirellulales bacterium]